MSTRTTPGTIHLLHEHHSLGYITGVTHHTAKSTSSTAADAVGEAQCHLFAGLPYALPPIGPYRFRRPRPLPPCHRYGTQSNPGVFTGGAGVCPQPAFREEMRPESWEEDCLQANVWVPVGDVPAGGWPVFFFIHGGWLQWGTPNTTNAAALLGETSCKHIIVTPAYRLNVFGFLASRELADEVGAAGNYGFWDQRLALEWTRKVIAYFGGDSTNITVAGYSAGAHSTFHQLAHDISLAPKDRIIRRAVLFSNGPAMQPKSLPSVQVQFDALLSALAIPLTLTPAEKLSRLRAVDAERIVRAAESLDLHEFRATTDDAFVSARLFEEIDSGVFAQKLRDAKVQLLIGETQAENFLYGEWRPPKANTFGAFRRRLLADYPPAPLDATLRIYCPVDPVSGQRQLPVFKGRKAADWSEAFGRVYADLQVHALERGLLSRLERAGAGELVKRYRIEWRARCVDSSYALEWGVTHGTDLAVWFFGQGMRSMHQGKKFKGLMEEEKEIVKAWLDPFWEWCRGENVDAAWGTAGVRESRRLKNDGSVDVWRDDDWERGVKIWDVVRNAHLAGDAGRSSHL